LQLDLYDFSGGEFLLLGSTSRAMRVFYGSSFYGVGRFSIDFPCETRMADMFSINRLIVLDKKHWLIIKGIKKLQDEKQNILRIMGKCLKSFCEQRICLPVGTSEHEMNTQGFDNYYGTAEGAMKRYVFHNLAYPTHNFRKIANFVIAPDLGRGENMLCNYRYDVLSNVLQELGSTSQLGWIIRALPDDGGFLFDCVKGTDRSAEQNNLARIVFSAGYHSSLAQVAEENINNYKNAFYFTKRGLLEPEGAPTLLYPFPNQASGIDRIEVHHSVAVGNDMRNIYTVLHEGGVPNCVKYGKELVINTMTNSGKFVADRDYFLGDYVSVRNENSSYKMQIVKIDYLYESGKIYNKDYFRSVAG